MHALKTSMNIKQSEYLFNVLRFNGAIKYYPDILYRKFKPGQGLEKKPTSHLIVKAYTLTRQGIS